MLSILRIGKCILRTWRGEWASYSPQHCLSHRLDVLARLAACLVFTGHKLVYPWGRPFLGVCLLAALRPKYRYEVLGSRYRERCTHLPRPASGRISAAVCHSVWLPRAGGGDDR